MNNLNGLWYRIYACGGVLLLVGILVLWWSRFWQPNKRNKEYFITGSIASIVGILYITFHIWILLHPAISVCEGILVDTRRNSRIAPPILATWEYIFDIGVPPKRVFYLDSFTLKEMLSDESKLQINSSYRITYEKTTRIVVGIESISCD